MAKETNKEKALTALLNSPTIAEAAEKCGLAESTLYRYLTESDFMKDYREARRKVFETSIGQIQRITISAVETLEKNLTSEKPSDQIRAAQIILDYAMKGIEQMDILERLEALENAAKTEN